MISDGLRKSIEAAEVSLIQDGKLDKRPTAIQLEAIRLNMQRQLRNCTGEELAVVQFVFPGGIEQSKEATPCTG